MYGTNRTYTPTGRRRRQPRRSGRTHPQCGSRTKAGQARAQADGVGAFLSTGTARNVSIYERRGFRVVEDLDAPGGGPHIWFMRWDR
jgi:hypothetical protein